MLLISLMCAVNCHHINHLLCRLLLGSRLPHTVIPEAGSLPGQSRSQRAFVCLFPDDFLTMSLLTFSLSPNFFSKLRALILKNKARKTGGLIISWANNFLGYSSTKLKLTSLVTPILF